MGSQPTTSAPAGASSPFIYDGPSCFLTCLGKQHELLGRDDIFWPDELVLSIAAYCELLDIPAGEVVLHFYPFGGLAPTIELISGIQAGSLSSLAEEFGVPAYVQSMALD